MQTSGAMNTISRITGRLLKPLTGRLTAKSEPPRAVSLVLSGGGARTFAQIGVIRAMEEAGIRIESAGGASGGAIIAALIALGWDAEKIRQTMRRHLVERGSPMDYVLPFSSLIDGRHFARMLAEVFGDVRIEGLPRRFFCVSCNLNRAELVVHESGLLRKAIAASMSVPGLVRPVALDGELLIDGGILNNLPVDVMKQHAPGEVWAVDVGINRDMTICKRYSASLPTWKIWWSRINPFAEPIKVPTVVDILMNTAMLASQRQSGINRQLADVCLRPLVDEFAAFDFKSFDRIVEIGYQCARQRIAEGFAEAKMTA